MKTMQIIFWISLACVIYAYAIYPLIMAITGRIFVRVVKHGRFDGSVSVVIASYNEAKNIGRRVREFVWLIENSGLRGEVIVVSDGSTDGTGEIARKVGDEIEGVARATSPSKEGDHGLVARATVRVIEQPQNMGKALGLNTGVAAANGEIIIFADSRQRWASDTLEKMLRNFADENVGAVGGELIVESSPGVMEGVGLYWKYEKWLRKQEARVHSTVGLSGSISAVRKELYRPLPAGMLLDDVCWPVDVALRGKRVVFEGEARAFDVLPEKVRDEFKRKVRTLSGNFQLMLKRPCVLFPIVWRSVLSGREHAGRRLAPNPIWIQFLSHKMMRLVVPWALLAMLVTSAAISGKFYLGIFVAQVAFYLLAIVGIRGAKARLASAAGSFVVLNSAAWLGFWIWILGRSNSAWRKVNYNRGTV